MQIIIHRINTIKQLKEIPDKYGVEVDIREHNGKLILNHEAFGRGDFLEDYLKKYHHKTLICNIKEAGIEQAVLDLMKKYEVKNYFLLDVEFPYLYKAARNGIRNIAVRYSEDESIETVLKYKGLVNWVWIDTNTKLPLTRKIINQLSGFKTCAVCPERWGRPGDILAYRKKMKHLEFVPTAVMTSLKYAINWEKPLG